ncbi:hypothetical protein HanRHA438_Chr14g0643911 [Helianthus annuus]|nr:hypothetical protein HanRHA438_Chr14g0643911 [Helianthus annuus]
MDGRTGGLNLTGSGRVIQISAAFMLFFSVFASVGPGHLQFCNLNSFRTKFILGLSFLIGLSLLHFFREKCVVSDHGPVLTHSRWVCFKFSFITIQEILYFCDSFLVGKITKIVILTM